MFIWFVNTYPDGPTEFVGWEEECGCQYVCGCWEVPVYESTRTGLGYSPWVETVDRFNLKNVALLAGIPVVFVWIVGALALWEWLVNRRKLKATVHKGCASPLSKPGALNMESYCFKCRGKQEIKDPEQVTFKNGRLATQGICSVRQTKVFRMGKP